MHNEQCIDMTGRICERVQAHRPETRHLHVAHNDTVVAQRLTFLGANRQSDPHRNARSSMSAPSMRRTHAGDVHHHLKDDQFGASPMHVAPVACTSNEFRVISSSRWAGDP